MSFCMAPWTHTFISPQSERRICCASREKSDFVQQYIDQPGRSGSAYRPVTLEEHWNGERMKSVRRRMLAGERLPECEVCNDQLLNLHTYRQYFEGLFGKYAERARAETSADGETTMQPVSFDYRLTNRCNFKCRMCGEQLSSSWEIEKRQHGEWNPENDPWMVPETQREIERFQKDVVEEEFAQAIRQGRVEEIYWVGGEPLVWEEHWKYMKQLVDDGNAGKVFVRYNTNLSRTRWKGVDLFRDLLPHFKGYNVCASIDAPGRIGEFIRTGLNWERWLKDFKAGLEYRRHDDNALVMDVTLTLPGLFGMKQMLELALELEVKVLVKIVYAFDPRVLMSPFALPRETLDGILDELIAHARPRTTPKTSQLLATYEDMKRRPTFQEQFPGSWRQGFRDGKNYLGKLAERRGDGQRGRLSIEEIYAANPRVLEWWNQG